MFGMDLLVTVTSTALALVAAILLTARPEATPLLLVPVLVAFVGYRAYVAERQGHEKVKFLYEANRTLSESVEIAEALDGLLARALEAFHAEQAEVILFAGDGGVAAAHRARPGRPARGDAAGRPRGGGRAALLPRTPTARSRSWRRSPTSVAGYLSERGVRHAHDRRAARREPGDRHDHAGQPLRPHPRLHGGRPGAVRHAGRQRLRRAAVRPARAGRVRAARAPGPAPAPGQPRPAHRPGQPRAVRPAGARGARGAGPSRRSR